MNTPRITPETRFSTNIATIIALIVVTFGAGAWATWMSLQIEFMKDQISEIKSDIQDIVPNHHKVTIKP